MVLSVTEGVHECACVCVGHVPVVLHFHLSSERMALAGARKAKALAWNNGSLEAKQTQKQSFTRTDCTETPTTLFILKNICVAEEKRQVMVTKGSSKPVTKSFCL